MAVTTHSSFILFVSLGILFEVLGDVLFKQWVKTPTGTLIVVGLGIYFIGSIFWAISLRYETLAKAALFFTVANALLLVGIGIVMFHEKLNVTSIIGIIIGMASLVLLEM